jgi:hypothetical protein
MHPYVCLRPISSIFKRKSEVWKARFSADCTLFVFAAGVGIPFMKKGIASHACSFDSYSAYRTVSFEWKKVLRWMARFFSEAFS